VELLLLRHAASWYDTLRKITGQIFFRHPGGRQAPASGFWFLVSGFWFLEKTF
jgi:hypothetical protein